MKPGHIVAVIGYAVISALLLWNLWRKQSGSALKKIVWSVIVCLPMVGWVFYGVFYSPPGENEFRAQGGASGWGPHLK